MSGQVSSAFDALTASTSRLQRTIEHLSDEQVAQPSLLPAWTRGHVLSHLARNADAMTHLVDWARTGVPTPMYPSRERRDADIEAGAHRSAAELASDVAQSHGRLSAALATLSDDQWQTTIRWGSGRESPASLIPVLRRVEVEVHHVDLHLDYTLAHLPEDLVEWMLADAAVELSERDDIGGFVMTGNDDEGRWTVGDGGPEITGTPPSLLGWVIGRTHGIGLHSDAPLPELGPWR